MGQSGTTILTSNFLILKNYSVRILGGTFFIPLSPTILHREITILNFAQIGHIALPRAHHNEAEQARRACEAYLSKLRSSLIVPTLTNRHERCCSRLYLYWRSLIQ